MATRQEFLQKEKCMGSVSGRFEENKPISSSMEKTGELVNNADRVIADVEKIIPVESKKVFHEKAITLLKNKGLYPFPESMKTEEAYELAYNLLLDSFLPGAAKMARKLPTAATPFLGAKGEAQPTTGVADTVSSGRIVGTGVSRLPGVGGTDLASCALPSPDTDLADSFIKKFLGKLGTGATTEEKSLGASVPDLEEKKVAVKQVMGQVRNTLDWLSSIMPQIFSQEMQTIDILSKSKKLEEQLRVRIQQVMLDMAEATSKLIKEIAEVSAKMREAEASKEITDCISSFVDAFMTFGLMFEQAARTEAAVQQETEAQKMEFLESNKRNPFGDASYDNLTAAGKAEYDAKFRDFKLSKHDETRVRERVAKDMEYKKTIVQSVTKGVSEAAKASTTLAEAAQEREKGFLESVKEYIGSISHQLSQFAQALAEDKSGADKAIESVERRFVALLEVLEQANK